MIAEVLFIVGLALCVVVCPAALIAIIAGGLLGYKKFRHPHLFIRPFMWVLYTGITCLVVADLLSEKNLACDFFR